MTADQTHIRRLDRADTPEAAAVLGQIMYAAIHADPSPYTPAQRQAWCGQAPNSAAWQTRLAQQEVFVAERQAGPVGFMTLARPEIDLAFVLPGARGQGVFRGLYDASEHCARMQKITRLTTYASLMAQPAFARMGFVILHQEEVPRGSQVLSRALMAKDLADHSG